MTIELLIVIGVLFMLRQALLKRQEQQWADDDEYEYYDEANDCWPSERRRDTCNG